MYLTKYFQKKKSSPAVTSWTVIGLGALVMLLGNSMSDVDERFRAGVSGFGLAHILLGALDMFRPTIKER
ncbi:MAG: hypothetical protein Q7J85_09240 [Bacillota bacterium]|nr:hypothetical protein [Bacillota bacterium]